MHCPHRDAANPASPTQEKRGPTGRGQKFRFLVPPLLPMQKQVTFLTRELAEASASKTVVRAWLACAVRSSTMRRSDGTSPLTCLSPTRLKVQRDFGGYTALERVAAG